MASVSSIRKGELAPSVVPNSWRWWGDRSVEGTAQPGSAAPPRLVLAIHEDTNANAALLQGGQLRAAVSEDRLTRHKFQPGFPARSVAEVLRMTGVALDEVDAIVVGNRTHLAPRVLGRASIEGEHDFFGPRHRLWMQVQAHLLRVGPLHAAAGWLGNRLVARRFGRSVALVDHHTAHAYSAYLTSGFPDALAISVDNLGDGYSARVFRCRGGRCEHLWSSDASRSPGQFYGEIAQFLGFHVLMAGKVTGLAAYGDAARGYSLMEELFALDRDETDFKLAPSRSRRRARGVFAALAQLRPADVAAAAQRRLEDVMVAYVRRALRETGDRRIVLAGGVFSNVLLNQKIWNLPEVDALFIHPAMSDLGIAAGAALAFQAERGTLRPEPIPHVFLGPEYDESYIGALLEHERVRAEQCHDIDARVAQLIVERRVVARFTGRMEYGPRALGNRSLLFHTADPSVNRWLNDRLERSEFMPFAPATTAEYARQCYEDYADGIDHAARFMTVTLRCTAAMKKASPAVVHVDGTARPQIVHVEHTPGLHRILALVRERTGAPSVINTSFNMHGEPIVCTPEDALRSFRQARLDALALGPFLITREDS